jgi:hypothetical protein
MLDDIVIIRFRESMEADLRPRDSDVRMRVEGADRKWGVSGNAMHKRGEIGCAELSARAEIIWQGMQRCYAAYQISATDESTISGINEHVEYWIRGESNVIRGLVDAPWGPAQARGEILGRVVKRGDELVRKLQNEARFYVHDLMNPPKKPEPSTAVNIQTNFGPVAVGAGAQAHSHIEIAGNVQLVQALETLRASFDQAPMLTPDERNDSLEVIAAAINAARELKPNKLTLSGLLTGVGGAVTLLADAPQAWESVKSAALLVGITLP